ncbi:MAG: hypothetical protein AB8B97_01770 [Granulosicoccus sp.]
MRKIFFSIIFLVFLPVAHAQSLPPVVNLQIEGNVLTWDPIDGADGYNIYLRGYYATVRDTLSFPLTEVGSYSVVAFTEEGVYSPLRGGDRIEFFGGNDNRPSFFTFTNDIVYRTVRCFDVEAGGTCEATCPDAIYPVGSQGVFLSVASGGACSSSDTANVNSRIGPKVYSCTVSSFTSRVEAQVACLVD